ncbi:MAG: four helix bundle protein [Rickettsiales bacterium]|nr:four helix bundle protein [Rickettsiales bacterium]
MNNEQLGIEMKEHTSTQKALKFAGRITLLQKYLCENKKEFIISKQIYRSGTSISANLSEAECAISKKDFLAKMHIAYKECSETQNWLKVLHNSGLLTEKQYESMYKDCNEIIKILTTSIKTVKRNLENEKNK